MANTKEQARKTEGEAESALGSHLSSPNGKQHRLLEAIIAETPDLVCAFDLEYRLTFANRALLEMWGRTLEESFGKSLLEIGYEPWRAEMHERELDQVIATKEPARGVASFPHPTLGRRIYDYIFTPVLGASGEVEAIAGTTRDITEIRQASERFRALVKASADVIYRMSPDWMEMYELKGQDFLANLDHPISNWLERYVPAEDRHKVKAAIHAAIREKSIFELEHRVIREDGRLGWTLSRAVPLLDESDEIVEWFGAASDITARKEAEEGLKASEAALKEADRRKDAFLATLAHELRNPLAPIANAVQIMRLRPDPQTTQEMRELIGRQVDQLVRLVDDLMEVSRISRGKVELRRERVQLADIVESAVETAKPLIEQHEQKLTVTVPPDAIWLDADPARLSQVLGNILNNAAKYTQQGGSIELTVERREEEAVVTVQDNGIGIPAEKLPYIFEMFTQVNGSTRRAQGGLGVGLALVKQLLELHGGSIDAASEGPGKGSRFTVHLPISSDAISEPKEGREEPQSGGKSLRVLVVDDNEESARTLAKVLELWGHDVRLAYGGLEAVKAAKSFIPDIVLLDIGMPDIDGYEVSRKIRQSPELEQATIIAQTGWSERKYHRENSRKAGFDHLLAKPVDMKQLEKLLAAKAEGTAGNQQERQSAP